MTRWCIRLCLVGVLNVGVLNLAAISVTNAQSPDGPDSKTFAQFLMLIEDDIDSKKLADTKDNLSDAKASVEDASSSDESSGETDDETDDEADDETDTDEMLDQDEDLDDEAASMARLTDPQAQQPTIQALSLADVIASLYQAYPEIMLARQETAIASGQMLSAIGAYDTKFKAHAIAEPTGFYRSYRSGLGLARQTWWGGQATAGYRIGRGLIQPWYQERQTNDAGEFKVGLIQPLLQGRAIDPQRVEFFKAQLAQQAPGPIILQTLLEASLDAAKLYWEWVAAGNVLEAQRQLLKLSEDRGEQFEAGVKAGKFPEIDLIVNTQLIAERRAQTLDAEQKFQEIAFKLSLYLRDENGQPLLPIEPWLPERFPEIEDRPESDFQDDLISALGRRPELQLLYLQLRSLQLDRELACNEMLPVLDLITEMSQDMGEPSSSSEDKGEFELVFGITSEVPIQRRKARGKLQSTVAKMAQTNQKLRLVRDKIGVEIQTATNQIDMSAEVVRQTEIALVAALETLDRYRFAFEKGKIDLIFLNLIETKANETQIKLVKSQQTWFAALANLQTAFGLDPLEQAITVSSLPPSDNPEPTVAPDVDIDDEEEDDIDIDEEEANDAP
ncbi:Outer membrane efflux protein [Rubripirellula obstinata]|uniref:Outer membrane efflux protein n=1 Tax=Rubripirellula obstinata TaxID=406547 RepID=A0A5B1CJ84_9BACT|nr:TolC family protein [Rubripirellula obstinata]KAA1259620.1 Outer membrane efflux protein [Rubripirellula obstinata]